MLQGYVGFPLEYKELIDPIAHISIYKDGFRPRCESVDSIGCHPQNFPQDPNHLRSMSSLSWNKNGRNKQVVVMFFWGFPHNLGILFAN